MAGPYNDPYLDEIYRRTTSLQPGNVQPIYNSPHTYSAPSSNSGLGSPSPTSLSSVMSGQGNYAQNTNTSTSETNTPNVPAWLLPYIQNQAQAASSLGLSAASNISPYMEQAANLFTKTGNYGIAGPTQNQLNAYINPYQNQVMDVSRRLIGEEYQRDRNLLLGRLAQTGAFGGSGSTIAESELSRNFLNRLSDQEAKQLSEGYQLAQQGVRSGMGIANQAAQGLGELGAQNIRQFEAGAGALNNLLANTIGATRTGLVTARSFDSGNPAVPNQPAPTSSQPDTGLPNTAPTTPTSPYPSAPGGTSSSGAGGGGGGGGGGEFPGDGGGGALQGPTISGQPLSGPSTQGGYPYYPPQGPTQSGQPLSGPSFDPNNPYNVSALPDQMQQDYQAYLDSMALQNANAAMAGIPGVGVMTAEQFYQNEIAAQQNLSPDNQNITEPSLPTNIQENPDGTYTDTRTGEMFDAQGNSLGFGSTTPFTDITAEGFRNGGIVGFANGGFVDFDKKYLSPSGAPYSHSDIVAMAKGGLVAASNAYHKKLVQGYENGGICGYANGGPVRPAQLPPEVLRILMQQRIGSAPVRPEFARTQPMGIAQRAAPAPMSMVYRGLPSRNIQPMGIAQRAAPQVMTIQDRYRQIRPMGRFANGGIIPHYADGGVTDPYAQYRTPLQNVSNFFERNNPYALGQRTAEGLINAAGAVGEWATTPILSLEQANQLLNDPQAPTDLRAAAAKVVMANVAKSRAETPDLAPFNKENTQREAATALMAFEDILGKTMEGNKKKEAEKAVNPIDELIKEVKSRKRGPGYDEALARLAYEGGGEPTNSPVLATMRAKAAMAKNIADQLSAPKREDKNIELMATLLGLKQKEADSLTEAKKSKYAADIQAKKDALELRQKEFELKQTPEQKFIDEVLKASATSGMPITPEQLQQLLALRKPGQEEIIPSGFSIRPK